MVEEFGAAATLEFTVDERSLAEVRAAVDDAVGDIPLGGPTGAAGMVGGGGAATDGGVAGAGALATTNAHLDEIADLAEEQVDLLEEIERSGGVGGGGGGGVLPVPAAKTLGRAVGATGLIGGLAGATAGIASTSGVANAEALTEALGGNLAGVFAGQEGGGRSTQPNASGAAPDLTVAATEAFASGVGDVLSGLTGTVQDATAGGDGFDPSETPEEIGVSDELKKALKGFSSDVGEFAVNVGLFGASVTQLGQEGGGVDEPGSPGGRSPTPTDSGRLIGPGGNTFGTVSNPESPGATTPAELLANQSTRTTQATRQQLRQRNEESRGAVTLAESLANPSTRSTQATRQQLRQRNEESTSAAEKRPPQVQVNITNELRNELNIDNDRELQRLLRNPQGYVKRVLDREVSSR